MSTQMRGENKFFGRHISKETSTVAAAANSSFRIYYGGVSGAVPFTWESHPGTPKHPLSHSTSLPPLTPPPSYYNYHSDSTAFRRRRCSRSKLFHSFWSKLNQISSSSSSSIRVPPSSSLSSSSWSSRSSSTRSSSSSSVPTTRRNYQSRRNWESFDDDNDNDNDDDNCGWRTPCFSFGRQMKNGSIRDVYAVGLAKKTFQTLMGRGSV